MSFTKRNIILILTVLVSSFFIGLNLLRYANETKIGTDAVSWFLPAKAIINKYGVPYKNYWDTKPNGLILFSTIWLLTFGESLTSFRFLHILLLGICVFGMLRIFRYTFPPILSSILFIISLVVFLSPKIQTQPLLIEFFGLSFSVIALNILITKKWAGFKRGFFASLFFILSSQMKESYAFISFSMIPFIVYIFTFNRPLFKKTFIYSALGASLCISILFAFIIYNSNFNSYREVFLYIRQYNSPSRFIEAIDIPKNEFLYFKYPSIIFLSLICILYFYTKYLLNEFGFVKKLSGGKAVFNSFISISKQSYTHSIVFFYAIGSWIGFMLQNKFGSHYSVQMVFPIMLLISTSLFIVFENIKRIINKKTKNLYLNKFAAISFIFIILLFIFPKKSYFIGHSYNLLNKEFISNLINNVPKPDLSIENEIMEKTRPTDCISHVYGWGVGTTYFYSNRRPCTRFFLANLTPEYYYPEYKKALINSPPAAIVYTLAGADLDTVKFENNAFNYKNVIRNCYKVDPTIKDVYLPRFQEDDLKKCLEINS